MLSNTVNTAAPALGLMFQRPAMSVACGTASPMAAGRPAGAGVAGLKRVAAPAFSSHVHTNTNAVARTDLAFKKWLSENMPAAYNSELSEDERNIIAHTLVYSEQYEEYIHLNFKSSALVISLGREKFDQAVFKHYATRGIREYRKYQSLKNLPGYDRPVVVARVGFSTIDDPESSVPMPGNMLKRLLPAAQKHDEMQFEYVQDPTNPNKTTLYFAWKNVPKSWILYKIARCCSRHSLDLGELRFAYLTSGIENKGGNVLLGAVHLDGPSVQSPEKMNDFMRELELIKFYPQADAFTKLVEKERMITGNQANLLRSVTSLLEQMLTEVNPSLYNEQSIMEAFCFHPELTVDFLRLFDAKFHPQHHNIKDYERLRAALMTKLAMLDTGLKKHDDRRRTVFQQAINITDHILRTNAYCPGKLGIGFRINPAYLDKIPGFDRKAKYPELPYGMFFVRGGNYMGMHVRFRDLARGGMRTVITRDAEHENYERPNMFSECYNLAYTQQKKNKDIPEGGSKSILFLSPDSELNKELEIARKELLAAGQSPKAVEAEIDKMRNQQRLEYMYSNQRCFLTTFLSLFVWDFDKKCLRHNPQYIVDYLNVPEYIYLGPDENFHDCVIQWLAKKSVEMGNPSRGAFISGKEDTGINHKHYGVTSWGVLQYVHQALAYANIGTNGRPFTVKMSGGPDGDVAGNLMKLLAKYYPKQAKLVVTTDGGGTYYDPEGFDWNEVVKLVEKGQTFASYPPELLHEGGWMLCMRKTRQVGTLAKEVLCYRKIKGKVVEDWISSNQAFHLYGTNAHTTKADIFLPCGGRPRSLNGGNVNTFFDRAGKPNSKVIVEGANLYITQEARDALEAKGVILFKDSSANKCGVISSSYEILGGLSMDDDQFVKVKPELAKNILVRLEYLANAEAKCMLKYYNQKGHSVPLSRISDLVSKKINQFTDDTMAYLQPLDLQAPENKKLLQIFINYIPDCIRRRYLAQAMARVPDMHKKAIIATHIACDFVYSKGLAWWPTVPDVLPSYLESL